MSVAKQQGDFDCKGVPEFKSRSMSMVSDRSMVFARGASAQISHESSYSSCCSPSTGYGQDVESSPDQDNWWLSYEEMTKACEKVVRGLSAAADQTVSGRPFERRSHVRSLSVPAAVRLAPQPQPSYNLGSGEGDDLGSLIEMFYVVGQCTPPDGAVGSSGVEPCILFRHPEHMPSSRGTEDARRLAMIDARIASFCFPMDFEPQSLVDSGLEPVREDDSDRRPDGSPGQAPPRVPFAFTMLAAVLPQSEASDQEQVVPCPSLMSGDYMDLLYCTAVCFDEVLCIPGEGENAPLTGVAPYAYCIVSRHPFISAFGDLLLRLHDGEELDASSTPCSGRGDLDANVAAAWSSEGLGSKDWNQPHPSSWGHAAGRLRRAALKLRAAAPRRMRPDYRRSRSAALSVESQSMVSESSSPGAGLADRQSEGKHCIGLAAFTYTSPRMFSCPMWANHSASHLARLRCLLLMEWAAVPLFRHLGIEKILQMLTALLLEFRVLVVSKSAELGSAVVLGLSSLLWPFSWQHLLLPICPASLQDAIIDAPVPFLCALSLRFQDLLTDQECKRRICPSLKQSTAHRSFQRRADRDGTVGTLCVLSMLKGADIQLLPSSFRAMEQDLHLTTASLAILALCQGLSCAITGPFWGNLVDAGMPRKTVLKVAVVLWGLCAISLGMVSHFYVMAFLRVLNGVALSALVPIVQSFVFDLSEPTSRGWLFGMLYFSSSIGQICTCLTVLPTSDRMFCGISGWRAACILVGVISLLVSFLVEAFIHEEPREWEPKRLGLSREVVKLRKFMEIGTFKVIIFQGVFGTIPGAAQGFTSMYFQYIGIPDTICGLIIAMRTIGDAIGGVLGGLIGDALAVRDPDYGRTCAAMFSVVMSLPFIYAVFMGIPRTSDMAMVLAGTLFLSGLLTTWPVPGCLNPVMLEIVPKRHISSAYAWDVALVFASGNTLGPLLVGYISEEFFGYKLSTLRVADMTPEARQTNADALGKALFVSSAIPALICSLMFPLLFWTYPADRRRMLDQTESEPETANALASLKILPPYDYYIEPDERWRNTVRAVVFAQELRREIGLRSSGRSRSRSCANARQLFETCFDTLAQTMIGTPGLRHSSFSGCSGHVRQKSAARRHGVVICDVDRGTTAIPQEFLNLLQGRCYKGRFLNLLPHLHTDLLSQLRLALLRAAKDPEGPEVRSAVSALCMRMQTGMLDLAKTVWEASRSVRAEPGTAGWLQQMEARLCCDDSESEFYKAFLNTETCLMFLAQTPGPVS
ncbi:unnamed protein product [Polarella glacialis]|uniref:Major facilitator superfamily (MFS) profile domain-containing protein n=1 Tax=Polarella glacialis TaxID=89957 RepID=A0A813G2S6_POLGL|nr:unnamed protein product [Polarella glacialis]